MSIVRVDVVPTSTGDRRTFYGVCEGCIAIGVFQRFSEGVENPEIGVTEGCRRSEA